MEGVRFYVLGPVELAAGAGAGMVPIRRLKQRILLVTLLLEANHLVSHERLTEALWDGRPPRSAASNLHTYVAWLRQALAAADPGGTRLLTRPGQYLLRVEPDELDLQVFAGLAEQARGALAREEYVSAARAAEQALGLWRGPAADRVPRGAVLTPQLEALDEQRRALLEDLAQARLALGEHATVVTPLRELVTQHPLRERAWAQLMLALYRAGDVAASLAAFQQARAALSDQLGIEPGLELSKLQQAILNRHPSLSPSVQQTHARHLEIPAEGPARFNRAGPDRGPRQLPRDVALVGRRREQCALTELVVEGDPGPVAAIHGPGGVGKSALAIHTAHNLAQQFPDGQLYIDLQPTRADLPPLDPASALTRLLTALGVPARGMRCDVGEAAAQFRSVLATRQVLLVADNAVDAAQVRPLLPAGPGCATIVTSRCMLPTLEGATHLSLDVLPVPEAMDLLAQVAGAARVAAEPDAAAKLVQLCDRLPLALRIVGARLARRPYWTIARFAARLAAERSRLDELEVGELSVRSCLQASHRPLRTSPDLADRLADQVFRLVGWLGRRDLSPVVVAASLNVTDVAAEEALDRLVDARLLERLGPDRYQVRDLPRLYAAEQAAGPTSDLTAGVTPHGGVAGLERCGR